MGTSARPLPRSTVALLGTATATSVAVAYYSQPLLTAIGTGLGMHASVTPMIVTLTQLGFAASLLLILPLGDMLDRRKLIVSLSLLSALALGLTALAPTGSWVLVLAPLVGAMAVVAQLLVAVAASLAPPAQRGTVVGSVMSGLLIGILLARTAAGLIADLAGWRAVYAVAGASMIVVATVLARRLQPEQPSSTTGSYVRLLGSVFQLIRWHAVLRIRMLFGAIAFAQFSILWTALTGLLSGRSYGYSESIIGLFGILGAAGAVGARFAGKLADGGRAHVAGSVAACLMLASWAALASGGASLVALALGIVLLDFAIQGMHITNQSQIYGLPGDARSRITSAYMTAYFAGGAIGSAAVPIAGRAWGWAGVCTAGAGFALLQLIAVALTPRHMSLTPSQATSNAP